MNERMNECMCLSLSLYIYIYARIDASAYVSVRLSLSLRLYLPMSSLFNQDHSRSRHAHPFPSLCTFNRLLLQIQLCSALDAMSVSVASSLVRSSGSYSTSTDADERRTDLLSALLAARARVDSSIAAAIAMLRLSLTEGCRKSVEQAAMQPWLAAQVGCLVHHTAV